MTLAALLGASERLPDTWRTDDGAAGEDDRAADAAEPGGSNDARQRAQEQLRAASRNGGYVRYELECQHEAEDDARGGESGGGGGGEHGGGDNAHGGGDLSGGERRGFTVRVEFVRDDALLGNATGGAHRVRARKTGGGKPPALDWRGALLPAADVMLVSGIPYQASSGIVRRQSSGLRSGTWTEGTWNG